MDERYDRFLGHSFRRAVRPFAMKDPYKASAQDMNEHLQALHGFSIEELENHRVRHANAQKVARRDPGCVLRRAKDPHGPLHQNRRERFGEEEDSFHDGGEAREAVEAQRNPSAQVILLRHLKQRVQASVIDEVVRELLVREQPIQEGQRFCSKMRTMRYKR